MYNPSQVTSPSLTSYLVYFRDVIPIAVNPRMFEVLLESTTKWMRYIVEFYKSFDQRDLLMVARHPLVQTLYDGSHVAEDTRKHKSWNEQETWHLTVEQLL